MSYDLGSCRGQVISSLHEPGKREEKQEVSFHMSPGFSISDSGDLSAIGLTHLPVPDGKDSCWQIATTSSP